MRSGFMLAGRTLVAHAWIDFHDGQVWQEADPTAGRITVDAVRSLISLGQIDITCVE